RPRDRHDLPGADDLAQSGPVDRAPAHRRARDPPGDDPDGRPSTGGRAARHGGNPRSGTAPDPVPASVQWRDATADDDRDGPRLSPVAALRRPTDDTAQ